ncbi:MAG: sugar kinase [Sphingobacteriales bacterium]|nr:sugar kinase [Sphingobacteriales bacterium]MBI3720110.1 sugar kinase [Sphingobacteriales bacterium]
MVFCFGEILLRMSPALNREWIKNAQTCVYVGGAELNVATALAKWNVPVKYFTAMPDNYMSHEIIAELSSRNIDTSSVHFGGDRIGIYILPQGTDLKHAGVIYDRAHSSFSALQPGMINWEEVLEDCTWFHFSAISPALNNNVAAVCEEALKVAVKKQLTISVDLNYRAKLWKYGKQPVTVMPGLVQYCDVIMGNLWSAESLLDIESPVKESIGKSKNELIDAALQSMEHLQEEYPKAKTVAYTFRLDEEYFALLKKIDEKAVSKIFPVKEVVDKVGSGDCFMGGLIYGLHNQLTIADTINFAAAAAVGKLKEKGDATSQTVESIIQLTKE